MDNPVDEEGSGSDEKKPECNADPVSLDNVDWDSEVTVEGDGDSSSGEETDDGESGDGDSSDDGSQEGSEWESATGSESDGEDDDDTPVVTAATLGGESSSSGSDGDEEVIKCAICLLRIRDQDVGTPESCDHSFCLECIEEWSKNVNQCPMDRQVFNIIFARHGMEGVIYKKIVVQDRRLPDEDEPEPEEVEGCEICGRPDREEWMLLCDRCDLGFHCQCLSPRLWQIPVGEWFCPNCTTTPVRAELSHVVERRLRVQRRRLIGRTRVSERVRAAIASVRATRGRLIIVSGSESDMSESESDYEYDSGMDIDLALVGTEEFDPNNPPIRRPRPAGTRRRKRKSSKRRKSRKKSTKRSTSKTTHVKRRKKKASTKTKTTTKKKKVPTATPR